MKELDLKIKVDDKELQELKKTLEEIKELIEEINEQGGTRIVCK